MSSSSARMTRSRLATTLLLCLLVTAAITLLAPLLGIAADGHSLVVLDLGAFGGDPLLEQIFWRARLPRVLAALLVGAGLAGAGAAFQAALRNPLAEPYTLGVSAGSSLAAVLAIRFGLEQTFLGASAIGVAALAGAAITIAAVWQLARVSGSLPPATLLLAGITIAMFCGAASMLVQYTADFAEITRMVRWMMGGLEWIRYRTLLGAGLPILFGVAVLLAVARDLNALAAGSDAAASVGVAPARVITIAFVTASLIVGASISLAGPIGFIGLIVSHAVRALVGPDHRLLMPASMLLGGALLIVCDTLARIVIHPAQLPVGVVTALIGGPFFLYILVREKRRGQLWG